MVHIKVLLFLGLVSSGLAFLLHHLHHHHHHHHHKHNHKQQQCPKMCRKCDRSSEDSRITIEPVTGRYVHSEGPHWDHITQCLFFVDIVAQKVYRFDPATDNVTSTYTDNGPIGFMVPVDDRPYTFVIGTGRDLALLEWNDDTNVTKSRIEILATVDQDHPGNRWNDGKCDSHGRLWAGTIGPEENSTVQPNQASFYQITSDLKPRKEVSPVTNSNGLAWNLEDNTLYYIDTPTRKIVAFDFDPQMGTISNKTVVFDLEEHNITGVPDGMTIDIEGNLWIAVYGGNGVINVDPRTGALLRIVYIPVNHVTSVAFGGPLLDILYVTTSSRDLSPEELEEQPAAGYVFAVKNLGVRGLLANDFFLPQEQGS